MKYKHILLVAIILTLLFFCSFALLKKYQLIGGVKHPPNILLISLDACRADHLSCYGYHRLTSPFLDELAEMGTRFENAFVNTLTTPPSHATILSSLYTETHQVGFIDPGAKSYFISIPENIVMVQEILKDNGYITLGVSEGKAFEEIGFSRGFTEFFSTEDVSAIDSVADAAIRLLKKYSKEKKAMFVFLHTYEIHTPYMPPKDYMQLFGNFSSNIPLGNVWSLFGYEDDVSKLSKEDLEYIKVMYDREIRFSDDILRKLFDELEKLDFFKNYLLIITSDHGEEFGDHGGLIHRGLLYDELIHVPLIIAGTDIPKKKVNKRLVGSIDIMPTILGVAGIHTEIPMEGKNLFSEYPKSENQEETIFSQYGDRVYCIRTPRWKLIETRDSQKIEGGALLRYLLKHREKQNDFANKNSVKTPPWELIETKDSQKIELYDLLEDPKEQNNVANENSEIANDLLNKLELWRETRLQLSEIKRRKVVYGKDTLDNLRTLGYIE